MSGETFDDIYEEFHGPIQRYLSRLVSDEESEDLTQDTFVKVSKGLPGFKGDSKLSTWIYRIATNTALDRLRSPARKVMPGGKAWREADTVNETLPADEPAADKRLEQKQMSECVRGVLDELPPDYKTVIVLSELDELSGRETADVLGISVEAAKVRLHRARASLKSLLDKKCNFSRDEHNVFVCEPKPTVIKFRKN